MRGSCLAAIIVCLAAIGIASSGCDKELAQTLKPHPPYQEELENAIFDAINQKRQEAGLIQLIRLRNLDQVARAQCAYLYGANKLSHRDARGEEVDGRLERTGIAYRLAGENVARNRGFADASAEAVRGWLNSEGHRRNILTAEFRETGIGAVYCPKTGYYYFAQVFLQP